MPTRLGIPVFLLLGIAAILKADDPPARLANGKMTQSRAFELGKLAKIKFPMGSPMMQNNSPARVFHLRAGGQISGELIQLTQQEITLKVRGHTRTLPIGAIQSIAPLTGEQQILFEDFENQTLSPRWRTSKKPVYSHHENQTLFHIPPGESASYRFHNPLMKWRLSAGYFDPKSDGQQAQNGIELQFAGENETRTLTISLASKTDESQISPPAEFRLIAQPLKRASGENRVTVLCDGTRFQVFLGSQLWGYGQPPKIPLFAIRLFSEPLGESESSPKSESGFGWDDLQFCDRVDPKTVRPTHRGENQSQAVLRSGDVIFGRIETINSQIITVKGEFGEVVLPWTRVGLLQMANQPTPTQTDAESNRLLSGWQVDVKFQRYVDHPQHPADWMSATLLAIEKMAITLEHPWLGVFTIPKEEVDWMKPRFYGGSKVLTAETVHLGNRVEATFQSPQPMGTTWQGEFLLKEVPHGTAFLSIGASELEPAGKRTPLGSRFLLELRNGFLGTEVFLNNQSLGRLNDQIHLRTRKESEQSLRLAIPAELLKPGKNTWRIQQTSRENHSNEFDECQVGPILLEIEQKPQNQTGRE